MTVSPPPVAGRLGDGNYAAAGAGVLLAGVREKDVTGLDTKYVFVP
jgi:hypothetical protein